MTAWQHPKSCVPGSLVIAAIGKIGQQPMAGAFGGIAAMADPKPVTLAICHGAGNFAVVAVGDADAVLRTDCDVIAWQPLPDRPGPDDIAPPKLSLEEIMAANAAMTADERRAKFLGA